MSAHAQPSSALSHTAHHNDSRRSLRDATPPVGAIMDIQMMHASHLFNADGLANGSVAQALAEKWGQQGNIEVQQSEDMDDGDEEPVDYDYEDTEQESHKGDRSREGHNRTGTPHTYTQPSAKSISHTHARVGDNIAPHSEVLSEEGTEDEERLYSSEDEGWEGGSRDEVESIVSEEDGPSDFDDNGGSDVRHSDDEEDDNPTDSKVLEEIRDVQEVFRGIDKHFRLINKIGEGTFSSVYKAEDLQYDRYINDWDLDCDAQSRIGEKRSNGSYARHNRRPKYVAIKKIYVTSSPARIQNELALLHDLSGCESVVPLITAFRHEDQVMAILPYFKHADFREYFRQLTIDDMRYYFRSLFSALSHVHEHRIIHRDIKPTNFLYDCYKRTGVLVDFGLAEREGTDASYCMCQSASRRDVRQVVATGARTESVGYPKNDTRPSKRANRAGTRGFRAPEVLFKCTNQTTKIDVWSAGVILLTMLTKRFPFFNSADDVDATIEIATIFGRARMRQCAALHGCIFETTIPTISEKGFSLEKIILWATSRTGSSSNGTPDQRMPPDEVEAVRFLQRCFELDPDARISADEALQHEFLYIDAQDESA